MTSDTLTPLETNIEFVQKLFQFRNLPEGSPLSLFLNNVSQMLNEIVAVSGILIKWQIVEIMFEYMIKHIEYTKGVNFNKAICNKLLEFIFIDSVPAFISQKCSMFLIKLSIEPITDPEILYLANQYYQNVMLE